MTHITGVSLDVVVVCTSPDANVKRALHLGRQALGFRRQIAPTVTYIIDMEVGISRRLPAQYGEKIGAIRSHSQRNFYRSDGANALLINGRTRHEKNKRRQLPHSPIV